MSENAATPKPRYRPSGPELPEDFRPHPLVQLRYLQSKEKVSLTAICLLLAVEQLSRELEEGRGDEDPALGLIGKMVGVSTAAMTTAIDQLTSLDLASRAPSELDRRKFSIRIHPKGKKLLAQINEMMAEL